MIPSLPGHLLGQADLHRLGSPAHRPCLTTLMKRLGYTRFVAQGGDWGDAVSEQMAVQAPPELLAIHTNMPATVPDDIAAALAAGGPAPAGLSPDEANAYAQLDFFYKHGLGYAQERRTARRPSTRWRIRRSASPPDARPRRAQLQLIVRVFNGETEGLTRDDILDNITLYWLTGTAVSSARLYWENKLAFFAPKHIAIPVAVSVFPDEIYAAPKSWAEKAFPKLVISTGCPRAATSPRGSSRPPSPPSCAPRSAPCAPEWPAGRRLREDGAALLHRVRHRWRHSAGWRSSMPVCVICAMPSDWCSNSRR